MRKNLVRTLASLVAVGALSALLPSAQAAPVPAGTFNGPTPTPVPTQTASPRIPVPTGPRPFRILAIGDSVMWGQGLSENHKFYNLVKDWVQGQAGSRPVVLGSTAHSGATVNIPAGVDAHFDTFGAEPGEIPTSYPTIIRQVSSLAPGVMPERDVDLLLIDGAANDVSLFTIADPNGGDVSSIVQQKVGPAANALLAAASAKYPNALIVVTGYYRAVSNDTELGSVLALKWNMHFPTPLIDQALRSVFVGRMQAFYDGTNATFQATVDRLNQNAGKQRALFVKIPWSDDAALGAAHPMVWRPLETDEAKPTRLPQCVTAQAFPRPAQEPFNKDMCDNASMMHPNVAGAAHYAATIEEALAPKMCDLLGLKPMRVTMTPNVVNADSATTVRVHAVDAQTNAVVNGNVGITLRGQRGAAGPTDSALTAWFLQDQLSTGHSPNQGGEIRATVHVGASGYCDAGVPYTFATPAPVTPPAAKSMQVTITFNGPRSTSGSEKLTVKVVDAASKQPLAAKIKIASVQHDANVEFTQDVCNGAGPNMNCKTGTVTMAGYPTVTIGFEP